MRLAKILIISLHAHLNIALMRALDHKYDCTWPNPIFVNFFQIFVITFSSITPPD